MLRIKVSGLVISLQGVVVPQSDSLLRAPEAKPKMTLTFLNTANHKPPAVSRFLNTSPCLFKATLLCNNTVFGFFCIFYGSSFSAVDSSRSLNRDRKGLKAKRGNRYGVLEPSESGNSMGILGVLVKDTRANQSGGRDKKGGLGRQPTGSMVNPRPPPLLFFGLGFASLCS